MQPQLRANLLILRFLGGGGGHYQPVVPQVLLYMWHRRYCYKCVLILLYMCPRDTISASSYYYVCVLILLSSYYNMCPHTAICVSSNYYIFVLILLYMCPHTTMYIHILLYMCPHTTTYVSSYYCICVLILLYREIVRNRRVTSSFRPHKLVA